MTALKVGDRVRFSLAICRHVGGREHSAWWRRRVWTIDEMRPASFEVGEVLALCRSAGKAETLNVKHLEPVDRQKGAV